MPNSLYLRIKIKNAKDSLTVSLAESKCSANSYWEMGTIDNLLAWPTHGWTDTPPFTRLGPLCAAPVPWRRKVSWSPDTLWNVELKTKEQLSL